ncbi:L-threonylcarbamoyladenylate synthase, partial [Micromonospora zhanjiangensis]
MFFDCGRPDDRERGLAAAVTAVRDGELVVLPTDTVYGLGADAFAPGAAQRLLDAKGRGRHMPPPVLVDSWTALGRLALTLPDSARDLADAFWPGALTLVLRHDPAVPLDLGDFGGTVAVRMPLH